jgi:cell division protein FtsI (penicillin-binding protein 3)
MAVNNQNKTVESRNEVLWRIYVVMFVMLLGCFVIILRIGTLQIIEGPKLREHADSMNIKKRPVKAARGNILADDGKSLLATSLPFYQLNWDLTVPNQDSFAYYLDSLAVLLTSFPESGMTASELREKLIRARAIKDKYFLIRKNVSQVELDKIKKFPIFNLRNKMKSGLIVTEMAKRQYPFKMLANRTIGYSRVVDGSKNDKDTLQVGLEGHWNSTLSGEEGLMWMQQLSKDVWVPLNDIANVEPRAGNDLVTTINIDIQDITERALLESMEKFEAEHGCVIVMEVKTGQIKAIANIGFNEDRTQYWEDFNYAVAENVEPGSVFKLASMIALLEDGHVKLDDTVNLNAGKWRFYDAVMEDAYPHGIHYTTLGDVFEMSSNVGIAKMIHKYYNGSKDKQMHFVRRLSDMVLDKPTGIDVGGERPPFIKDPNRSDWSGISALWMSIGYELEMSPLQMLTFYNAVANGGQMMKPYVVKEVRSYGDLVDKYEPLVVKKKIASKKTLDTATELLTRVVESDHGTAHSIYTPQYKIAGKTGTAIINWQNFQKGKESKKYRASFAGFFPADNPVYSCIVVVTNPKWGNFGGIVAAPVFRKIADFCYASSIESHKALNNDKFVYTDATLPKLQVGNKDDLTLLLNYLKMPYSEDSKSEWSVGFVENDSVTLLNRSVQDDVVPNVVGMGLKDALYLLENRRLKVKVVGVGKVKSQSVKAGKSIKSVQTITLVLG